MGRKKSSAASGFAALCALCVVSLALFTVYVKEGDCSTQTACGPLHTVQLGAAEVLQPVRGVVGALFTPIRETADRVGNAFDDSEEERLRAELRDAEAPAAQAPPLQPEDERLRGPPAAPAAGGGAASDGAGEGRLRAELRDAEALAAQASQLQQENERLRGLLEGQRAVYAYGPAAGGGAPGGERGCA